MTISSVFPSFAASESRQNILQPVPSVEQSVIANQETITYRVVRVWNSTNIVIKSLASGREFDVYFSSRIGADVGDLVTVTFNGDRWISIVNNKTGMSAAVTSVSRR
ncbi:MAG: hypothetical protein WCO45_15605 [Pseudanabaena sp. ELA607]